MVFMCQKDSFLKQFTTQVVSCTPTTFEVTSKGQRSNLQGFEVICNDTILFPEGGGQPFDCGFLNDIKVHQVLRKGDTAVHYVTESINPGEEVKQLVNWTRRFDHMQQHSGQHLLSAVIERDFGIRTMSWWLGEEISHVELETSNFSVEIIKKVEESVNEYIREARSVTVQVLDENTPEEILRETRSVKGLPADHKGDIRVINIDGIDSNMCCGTHVKNLSQLQAIKLLHCEKSKRKGQCLLYFLVGQRLLKQLNDCIQRETKITALLNNGPAQHVDLIEKLQRNLKISNKNLQLVLKELAVEDAKKIKDSTSKYFCLHRKEAEADFMNNILREVGDIEKFLFLATGNPKGTANILLHGDEQSINDLGSRIAEILGGKGAGKGKRFQAKVTNLGNISKVNKLLKEYFEN